MGCELVGNLREGRVVSIPFSIHSARKVGVRVIVKKSINIFGIALL